MELKHYSKNVFFNMYVQLLCFGNIHDNTPSCQPRSFLFRYKIVCIFRYFWNHVVDENE